MKLYRYILCLLLCLPMCFSAAVLPFIKSSGPNRNGLVLWLAADKQTGLNDGDPVGTWTDFSGQGNHATQATAAKKPLYKTNILNGRPVMRFDGVDDELAPATITAARFTIFCVVKATSQNYISPFHSLTSGGFIMEVGYWRLSRGNTIVLGNTTLAGAGFNVMTGISADSGYTLFQNGVDVSQAYSEAGFTNPDTIGGSAYATAFLNGDIAEVLVYNRALSTAERQFEENRLLTKYALP